VFAEKFGEKIHRLILFKILLFFLRKLAKIAENCDHNIDPFFLATYVSKRPFNEANEVLFIDYIYFQKQMAYNNLRKKQQNLKQKRERLHSDVINILYNNWSKFISSLRLI
jgi:hypothetical protein